MDVHPIEHAGRVALAGDVSLELLAPYFRRAGFETYVPPGFGAWRQEVLDGGSAMNRFAPDVVFDVTAFDADLSAEVPGFFDERMRALAAMPYSLVGIRALVDECGWALAAAGSPRPKKILAVDADNTLWRGILSEDGRGALSPVRALHDGLRSLAADGVVLVLLSKNDPGSLDFVDLPFAARRVNWGPKPGNLIDACRELNLGTESAVFLDDNPYERAQMSAHLPETAVAPWSGWSGRCEAEARQLVRRLRRHFFSDAGLTEEDRLRTASYGTDSVRRELRREYDTVDAYLEALELRVRPSVACEGDLDRLAQMAGKTNQFNATTIRRTRGEFAALVADPSKKVYVFRTSDRFGEQGLVCYIVVDLAAGRITDFVMSCRAMGRTLERFAYDYVSRDLGRRPGIDFVPTAKNAPFREFLASLDSGSGTRYREA